MARSRGRPATGSESALDARIGDGPLVGLIDLVSCTLLPHPPPRAIRRIRPDLPTPFPPRRRRQEAESSSPTTPRASIPCIVQTGTPTADPLDDVGRHDGPAPSTSPGRPARRSRSATGSQDAATLRQAVRHVKEGGLIGIFPEGTIARPPREIRPFQPGVGLLARLSKAPVLVLWIHDTPYTETAGGSIFRRSHSVVEFVGVFDLSGEKDPPPPPPSLRNALADHSGWPRNEESTLTIGDTEPTEEP